MRVNEMQEREAFLPVFHETVARAFKIHGSQSVEVQPLPGTGQVWLLQRFLSACYVRDTTPRVRAFLRDSIAHTAVRWRAPLQLGLGIFLSGSRALQFGARPCFAVKDRIPNAGDMLIIPGNLRIRLYDFRQGHCLVVQKYGFSTDSMRQEVEARRVVGELSLPVMEVGSDFSWFREPIFDGYALARCPSWWLREPLEARVFDALGRHTSKHLESMPAQDWASTMVLRAKVLADRMCRDADSMVSFANRLAEATLPLGEVIIGDTHGDMQPGNVLVSRDGHQISIIDWEYRGRRLAWYDPMVYYLGARRGRGLVEGVARFVCGRVAAPPMAGLPRPRAWRRAAAAAFLLEDLVWLGEADSRGLFASPTPTMRERLSLRSSLLKALELSATL